MLDKNVIQQHFNQNLSWNALFKNGHIRDGHVLNHTRSQHDEGNKKYLWGFHGNEPNDPTIMYNKNIIKQ